jgi:Ca-activated chloride channel family protein
LAILATLAILAIAAESGVTLTWGAPAALWLLLGVPLVWLADLVAHTNFNRRQRLLQKTLRSLLLTAVVLALARPVISSSSSHQSVVYAIDVSDSVASHAIETAAVKIDELNGALRPSHTRIVTFGRDAVTIESTEALRQLAKTRTQTPAPPGPDGSSTDLEAALYAARGELATEHVPRVVLFSDGHPTSGDTGSAVTHLAAERIPVSVEPLAPRSIGDSWIDSFDMPSRIASGALLNATVTIGSQRSADGEVEVRLKTPAAIAASAKSVVPAAATDRVLVRKPVTFDRGLTEVPLEFEVDAPGAHVLEVALIVNADPLGANNVLMKDTWADPRSKVLYVEGAPSSARYLAGALDGAGFDVTVRPASGVPATATDLEPFDVVVLSDIPRKAIPDGAMTALTEWVEKAGGGLLVAGGEAVFGENGYRKTPIERLTPVTFERKDEPEVALVIVLDRSWSMAGSSMELTKTAAQAAVDVLSDEQSIGILTFNDKFAWDVTLRNVGRNRDAIRKKIAAIGPGGHTLIYPAVEQAYLALRNAKARARHVILLSDGRSYPGDYEGLVRKMSEARITVSTVAVGPSADPELLKNLAQWGKGRAYAVADAAQVPEIFVKEAKTAASPGFDEKTITPVVKSAGFLSSVNLSRMPKLKGRTATVLKDGALELMATDEEDPLLAFWPIGLGRTAVFASDVKDRWAADWVRWPGYGPFFASLIRALQRQRSPAVALEVSPGPVRGGGRTVAVAVEARDATGQYRNLQNPVVRVGPSGRGSAPPARVVTRQVAPGRYEATVMADATQLLRISVEGADARTASGGATASTVVPDPAAEYRFRAPDETLLRSIASATGGAYHPTPASLANATGDSRTARRPVWPALLTLALILWFLDLLLRRIRVFEPRVETHR